jgi:hypothetical protein
MDIDFLKLAHKHSFSNRAEIDGSFICGCFYCLEFFYRDKVTDWTDFLFNPDGNTALCPKCAIDSVIGDASGLPITLEFLTEMKKVHF